MVLEIPAAAPSAVASPHFTRRLAGLLSTPAKVILRWSRLSDVASVSCSQCREASGGLTNEDALGLWLMRQLEEALQHSRVLAALHQAVDFVKKQKPAESTESHVFNGMAHAWPVLIELLVSPVQRCDPLLTQSSLATTPCLRSSLHCPLPVGAHCLPLLRWPLGDRLILGALELRGDLQREPQRSRAEVARPWQCRLKGRALLTACGHVKQGCESSALRLTVSKIS